MIFSVAFIGRMAALRRRIRSVVSGADYDPYWDSVIVFVSGEGAEGATVFEDQSATNAPISVNGTVYTTAQESYFRDTSARFDKATKGYLYTQNALPVIGEDDFTAECFVYPTTGAKGFFHLSDAPLPGSLQGIAAGITDGGEFGWYRGNDWGATGAGAMYDQWLHIAITREAGLLRFFLNGSEIDSFNDAGSYATDSLAIGAWYSQTYTHNGYLDHFRLTKGVARYTANFTPPTAPFPTVGAAVSGPGWPQAFIDGQTMGPSGPEADHQYDPVSDTGYYGFVETADLIRGDDLASQIGLTAGTAQFSDSGWFKFYVGPSAACNRTSPVRSYVIYVASMPYRHSVSWDVIDAVNAVYGDRTETIGSHDYRVRLIQGSTTDPTATSFDTSCADDPGLDSEWNELFYRIHTDVPDCSDPTIGMPDGSSTSRHGGPQSAGSNWAEYTNAETGVYNSLNNGSACWAQETDGIDTSRRVRRGNSGLAGWVTFPLSLSNSNFGWRPVLEFVS